MTNSLGYLFFGLGLFINAWPADCPQVKPTQNTYRVAEQMGCVEVGRVCRAKHRMEAVKWNGTKRSTRMN